MKRDMDLLRDILLAVDASDRRLDSTMLRITGYPGERITEHLRLLGEAGLLAGYQAYSADHGLKWIELRLTWDGHEFLDAARNEAVWMEAMAEVRTNNGSVPFEVLKDLLLASTCNRVQDVVVTLARPLSTVFAVGSEFALNDMAA